METFKKYFIPHHKNEYKPKALCVETAVFILAVVLIIETAFIFQSFVLTKTDFFASLLPNAIIKATNEKRMADGGAALKINPLLQKAAELKAQDMAKNGYFSHNSPDGKTPWRFLDAVKYDYNYAGENLAINFTDSSDVVNAWFNSETHKENLLSKNYSEIGVGTAIGTYQEKETIFVVQFFGSLSAHEIDRDDTSVKIKAPVKGSSLIAVSTKKELKTVKPLVQNQSNLAFAEPSESPKKVFSAEVAKENVKQIIASPRKTANYFLIAIFTIVLLTLALKIFIKIKIQHPPLIINGALLLIIISAMLALNQYLILSQGKII